MPKVDNFERQPLMVDIVKAQDSERNLNATISAPQLNPAGGGTAVNGSGINAIETSSLASIENAQPIANVSPNSQREPATGESWSQWGRRHGANAALSLFRNTVSVGVPTFCRETLRRTLFSQMAQASTAVGAAGAVVGGGALPIGLQAYGLWRDNHNGTQTRLSVVSRVAQIMATGSIITALAATGGAPALAAAAPALMAANFVYTPMRDAVQYFLRLGDNNNSSSERPMSLGATAISATAYGLNQTGVSYGMDELSSVLTPQINPGGATQGLTQQPPTDATTSSSGLLTTSHALTPESLETWNESLAKGLGNGVGRGLFNVAGETVDDLVSRYTQASLNGTKDGKPLEFTLDIRPVNERTWTSFADQVTDAHASRSNLFASALSAAYLADSQGASEHAVNAVVGGVLGALYPTFVMSGARPNSNDLPAMEEGRGTNSVLSEYPASEIEENETSRGPKNIAMTPVNSTLGSQESVASFETAATSFAKLS
jgi:hypothetical protein